MEQVIGLKKVSAGLLVIVGQLADGIGSPLAGAGLDSFRLCGQRYGRRKSWHLVATIGIAITLPFIFSPPPKYETNSKFQNSSWTEVNMVNTLTLVLY